MPMEPAYVRLIDNKDMYHYSCATPHNSLSATRKPLTRMLPPSSRFKPQQEALLTLSLHPHHLLAGEIACVKQHHPNVLL